MGFMNTQHVEGLLFSVIKCRGIIWFIPGAWDDDRLHGFCLNPPSAIHLMPDGYLVWKGFTFFTGEVNYFGIGEVRMNVDGILELEYSPALSLFAREHYPGLIKEKDCYGNVYRMLDQVEELNAYHLHVLFCYIPIAGSYIRHAFCIADGYLVEPLCLPWSENYKEMENIVVIRLLGQKEYLRAVIRYGYYDLFEPLLRDEVLAYMQHDMDLNIVELVELVGRVSETREEFIEKMHQVRMGDKPALNENYRGLGISKERPLIGERWDVFDS